MPHRLTVFAFLAALLTSIAAWGQDSVSPPASVVQQQLQDWVKTRQLISQEKSDWKAEKATLSELNEIRKSETAQLGEFIEAAGKRVDEIADQREQFEEEEQVLKAWRKTLQATLESLENEIRPLLARFPAPLREKVEESILRLEEPDADHPLQQRTRDILLVMQAYLDFQNAITLDGGIREIDGERREIDILYLGLTQAWFVDATGNYGGSGIPTDSGWVWTTDSSIAGRVREAIDIHQKKVPAEFLSLPLQNMEETGD